MHTKTRRSSFTSQLDDFAWRLASFSALASQSRNVIERSSRTPGMPRMPAPGPSPDEKKNRQDPQCPRSIARLCRTSALTPPEHPDVLDRVSKTVRQVKDLHETPSAPLVLVKLHGFDKILEVTLSPPGSLHEATVHAPDFMSVGITMLTKSGTFRVASSRAAFVEWRTYLDDGPEDRIMREANRWLAAATMKKRRPGPHEDAGLLTNLYTSHDQWERVCLTIRIFKSDGGRRRLSHIRNWSPSAGSGK
ncbi:MAG: hypothetical protein ACN6QT_26885 [Burkholderia contaminans]|uniref:Uncharacterized protein n=1 Tax=Burkholderia contaminans TaxID=488447 RepID=A0AAP4RA71_9BURK|nr:MULTISPECIES: hypothetical protein [Burkholderia]MCA7879635.1 hypothetical protein [Burkholderia contaminans]MDN7570297.1 hypothetical protein [Burkholderia contaminans]MDN8026654.1 hypothetical protein [Burkholderia contaminans]UXZ67299.1 hypothetical protein NUJ29_00940 [Burkholderia contaminans]UXZ75060.1 hypothetical protein NUJ30_00930 [Burkholderia contaminans]